MERLIELDKRFNVQSGRDLRATVRRIQRHGILVLGFFIVGLDVDQPGIGQRIDEAAKGYGLDAIVVGNLTPLPGTRVWTKMEEQGRIVATNYPEDWKYYTLTFPVARHEHMSWVDLIREKETGMRAFYSYPRIAGPVLANPVQRRKPFLTLLSGLFYRDWVRFERKTCRDYLRPSTHRGRPDWQGLPALAVQPA